MIIDTHAHYDDDAFNEDRESLLLSLTENNIEFVVNVGASIASTLNSIKLSKEYPFVYATAGVHPSETMELNEKNFEILRDCTGCEKVVAVGEIGLDYHWKEPEREIQQKWFKRQLKLAKETGLPVVIHSRDAAKDTLEIMKEMKAEETGGVIHCYSYTREMAREYLNMGYYFGIGGVVTFDNAKKLKEAVEYIPMENIVLETDSPYLAPVPNRGKRNSSLNLSYVAKEIAKIKGISYDNVIEITNINAKKLYHMG